MRRRLLCVILLLAAARAPARAQAPGGIVVSVLSYNTHGLPGWIARDDPPRRYEQIAALARNYSVAAFQEDFVSAYHDVLARGLSDGARRVIERGNGTRAALWGWWPTLCPSCGSGLALAADPALAPAVLARQPFGTCSGWAGGANDCWATKGFLQARLRLPNATSFDFYTLHLDAGHGKGDADTRAAQLDFLRDHIAQHSAGTALIVAGDFNLDAFDPGEFALLSTFRDALGLADSGAQGKAPPWPERIDYILYRSSAATELTVLAAREATEFVDANGQPLSDHPAIHANFRVVAR